MSKLGASLLLCLILIAAFTSLCVAAENHAALSRINDAGDALRNAFSEIQKVERLNANVSTLISRLNVAGDLLAEAEIAYNNEDLSTALRKADQSLAVANEVLNDTVWVYNSAFADAHTSFWTTVILPIEGTVLFALVLVVVWEVFAPYYVKKLLKMKAEVPSDADA